MAEPVDNVVDSSLNQVIATIRRQATLSPLFRYTTIADTTAEPKVRGIWVAEGAGTSEETANVVVPAGLGSDENPLQPDDTVSGGSFDGRGLFTLLVKFRSTDAVDLDDTLSNAGLGIYVEYMGISAGQIYAEATEEAGDFPDDATTRQLGDTTPGLEEFIQSLGAVTSTTPDEYIGTITLVQPIVSDVAPGVLSVPVYIGWSLGRDAVPNDIGTGADAGQVDLEFIPRLEQDASVWLDPSVSSPRLVFGAGDPDPTQPRFNVQQSDGFVPDKPWAAWRAIYLAVADE